MGDRDGCCSVSNTPRQRSLLRLRHSFILTRLMEFIRRHPWSKARTGTFTGLPLRTERTAPGSVQGHSGWHADNEQTRFSQGR